MARRTNFGFEKRQRELRKQKKRKDKAERRLAEEPVDPARDADGGADQTPPGSEAHDRD